MIYDTSNLFLWRDFFLYVGKGLSTQQHKHHALQIAIALDHCFLLEVEDAVINNCSYAVLGPDVPHYCDGSNSTILFLNIYPETHLGLSLVGNLLQEQRFIYSSEDQLKKPARKIFNSVHEGQPSALIYAQCLELLHQFNHRIRKMELDARIQQALDYIHNSSSHSIRLSEVANIACLSEGRLTHLFKAQVGIPIRRYILWTRTCDALQKISEGEDLTGAAIEAGFSDSAHLSRTFQMVFGLPPTEILNNSQFIQANLHIIR